MKNADPERICDHQGWIIWLQPGNHTPSGLRATHVLPQLHVLLWGNKRGV